MDRNDLTNFRTNVLDTLTLSFSADPIVRWLYPDARSYLAHFPAVISYFGGAAFDHDTAQISSGSEAASLWLPPDVHPDGDGLLAYFDETLTKSQKADFYKVFDIMEAVHPETPCWHLAFIGTDPAKKGHRHGSALMQQMLPRCDAEGQIAYLENTNPANIPFYERHGFRVIGEIQAGAVPPMYAMRRDPC